MARPRADDYEDKRQAILHTAAKLIAENGYDRTSMQSIAKACRVSKGLLYHYYRDKEAILFDSIGEHLDELIGVVEVAAARPNTEPIDRLQNMVIALLEAYRDADAEHQVQITGLRLLPHMRQEALKSKERILVRLLMDAIDAACPHLGGNKEILTPVTMSLFGMLNWHYMWFREGGPMTRADYANLATRIIVQGVKDL